MKAQGATEYLVTIGVVLVIALVCVALLTWPVETTNDAKTQQADVHYKIAEIGSQTEGYPELVQGLIGYWKFEEGSGINATDSRGGNTGNLTNAAWVSGKSGTALDLDGLVSTVPTSLASNADFQNGFTVSAWIYPRSVGEGSGTYNWGTIVNKASSSNGLNGFMYCFGINGNLVLEVNGDTRRLSAIVPMDKWTHVAVTVSSDAIVTHYVNGAVSGTPGATGALSGITTSNPLTIGNRAATTVATFNGTIDEVMVFNRALSADEIRLLYENPGYPQ
ncbi:Concanavalin A-like lectin/glucanases superfamily protein [Candidatus Anstonella stagnisolia]|nr:Concanavalin A-like lectin/glucanases superfamily protein [Candidatus Anstonella stagnisolia]